MVGLIKDKSKIVTQYFKKAGDIILLLGKNKEELGGSEYLKTIHGLKKGKSQYRFESRKERAKNHIRRMESGLVQSAHDCSEGGLAAALQKVVLAIPLKIRRCS